MSPSLRDLYRSADQAVRTRRLSRGEAAELYSDYVAFVTAHAPAGRLLDLGCGAGWSSSLFAAQGYDVVGLDLAAAFEPPPGERLRFSLGDAARLPFPDGSFDAVAAYQFLEHVPDPQSVLLEVRRVLRPGGWFCLVGPNLMGLTPSLTAALFHVWRNRPVRRIFLRDEAMPRHPYGNTLPEIVRQFVSNAVLLASKLVSSDVRFHMRTPDTVPPFHADNDARFLLNPLDLARALHGLGFEVVRSGKPGRLGALKLLVGGTWVAAKRGNATS